MSKRDYYEVLGVAKDAGQDEIKKSYRKLAMKYHPDRNPDDKAAEDSFKEVGEAYSILSDQKKRAQYDRFGHAATQQGAGGFEGFNFGGEGFDPFDIFRTVFGGGFSGFGDDIFGRSGSRGRRRAASRGSDLSVSIKLTLEEIAKGVEKKVKIKYQAPCKTCSGSGSKDGSTDICARCQGSGEVRQMTESLFGRVVNITTCAACSGEGRIISHPCTTCNGTGLEKDEKLVNIHVPAGISNGQYLRLRDQGNNAPRGGVPGDIIVNFSELPHELFTRHGDDVLYDLTIGYSQAVLGTSIEVPTLTGRVKYDIPPGTPSGKLFRLRGKGIAHINDVGHGDQLVRVSIFVPKKVNSRAQELLKELEEEIIITKDNEKTFFKKVRDVFSS